MNDRARTRGVIAGMALLLGAGAAAAATGQGFLAAPAASADLLHVTCFDDGSGAPASLAARVTDLAPVADPFVSVQLRRGNAATNGTDPIDGDATPGPVVWIDGGAGDYLAFVDKSGAGQESYQLLLQCTTGPGGGGVPTGTLVAEWPAAVPVAGAVGRLLLVAALGLAASGHLRRRRAAAASLAAALALPFAATPASAHTQNGSLGAGAAATDHYQVTCSGSGAATPQSLAIQILDTSPGALPLISAQVQRGDALVNTSDTIDADAVASPQVAVDLGAGVYQVLVDKTGAGAKSYSLSFHCYTGPGGTGNHTGTSITTLQNQ